MVISLNDFNNLKQEEKKDTLQILKNEIGVTGMVNAWGVSRSKVYGILNDFNIPLERKGRRAAKTTAEENLTAQEKQILAGGTNGKKSAKQNKMKKLIVPQSSLDLESEDNMSKFSLYLETEGNASFISETLQTLLAASKLSNTIMHVNIKLQEI